jgi:hypothetical protein
VYFCTVGHNAVILEAILYDLEMRFLILRELHKLQVSVNTALMKICGMRQEQLRTSAHRIEMYVPVMYLHDSGV